jgi:hypothetical protein
MMNCARIKLGGRSEGRPRPGSALTCVSRRIAGGRGLTAECA